MEEQNNENQDLVNIVIYEKYTKKVVAIIYNVKKDLPLDVHTNYVMAFITKDSYNLIQEENGEIYFQNLDEKLVFLDDYRGRYKE